MVRAMEWANILHTMSSAFSNDGAANIREDKEGEKVVEDD
jgi:hypothetical protein